jgi:hypothetical protein
VSQRWLRLVSCLSLVAYLLSSTHLKLAIAVGAPSRQDTQNAYLEPGETEPATPRCKHCARCRAETSPTQPAEGKQPIQRHDSDCPDFPFGPSCPCCPGGDHTCPVPGGCSMCSIAKEPCLTPLPAPAPLATDISDRVPEFSVRYVPPPGDGLIRPPKA